MGDGELGLQRGSAILDSNSCARRGLSDHFAHCRQPLCLTQCAQIVQQCTGLAFCRVSERMNACRFKTQGWPLDLVLPGHCAEWREGREMKQVSNWEGADSAGMLSPLNVLYYLSAQVSLVWAVQKRQGGAVFQLGERERTRKGA